jgi:hypothetical protein
MEDTDLQVEKIETPKVEKSEQDTYLLLGDEASGLKLEIDLVTYREKGERVKYFSIALTNSENVVTQPLLSDSNYQWRRPRCEKSPKIIGITRFLGRYSRIVNRLTPNDKSLTFSTD